MKLGMAVGATALTLSGLSVIPAAAADVSVQAYSCNATWTSEGTDDSKYYAGYYSGETVQPSSTSVSAAGKEAQCILKHKGYSPGTVDGIFGSNSQVAAKKFQARVNELCGRRVLAVDGKVGPATWPYLRQVYICWDENN
ncbi:peptidoglycan-binding domain-containing protein [Streptomyces sp. TRM 70361]|uniref:peptidoglycan-binding domain-containing protein n=1 Tax=Streptomyces sp. TRM 70361 TaxID=3116553 RepID=UPI002E7B9BC1|nr:peptidoglycan-binding domain-containing protein [Streptomyces sp. TRM 70361]MEE1943400.1 peptidoglycan-binding domain-containing protein [Streptomyces sp. TRM 70361]